MIKPRMMFAHMRAAQAYGKASYARRLQVGCVIVDEETDQPVCIGWNGTAPGHPNVCEIEVEGQLVSHEGVVHAEINALARIPEAVDNRVDLTMFVSHSPCPACTKEIIKSCAIKRVIYCEPYRITTGIVEMMNAGIEVYRMVDQFAILKYSFNDKGELTTTPLCVNPDK